MILGNKEHTRNDKEVEEEVLSAFSILYNSVVRAKPFVHDIDWCSISPREDEDLEVPFTLDEYLWV